MNLTIGPRGILQIDDARIVYRNFSGKQSKYNRPGDMNFALVIPDQDMANKLIEDGWNVKIKAPRHDGEDPFMFMTVKVKFNGRGPNVYLVTGNHRVKLDEESIGVLDNADAAEIDMDIRPYDWEMDDGKSGRTAYLHAMQFVQNVDRFTERFAEEESPEELPFD